MSKPHIHAEVIKAWADGKQVQYYHLIDGWIDVEYPSFVTTDLYRVKPKTLKYRVALFADDVLSTTKPEKEKSIESFPSFSLWLTDWVEVEI